MQRLPTTIDPLANACLSNEGFASKGNNTIVFYDGSCPLCRHEINFYKRLKESIRIEWRDLSLMEDHQLPSGLSLKSALKRFHVQSSDGSLLSGGMAFVHLWSNIPQLAFVGKVGRLPVISNLIELFYSSFLYCRPAVSTALKRFEENRSLTTN